MTTKEGDHLVTAERPVPGPGTTDSTPTQFARNASGLIRSASLWDAFGVNAINGVFVIGIAWVLLYTTTGFSGGNLYLAILGAVIVAVPVTVVYLKLSVVYPRSGGDYVYNSRLLHPAIGFAGNLIAAVGLIYWTAFGGVYVVAYGIAPGLITAGIQLHIHAMTTVGTWISGKAPMSVLSLVVIALFGVFLNWGGNRAYFRFQKVALVLGGAALLVCVVVGLTMSRSGALANLNHLFKGMGVVSASSLEKGGVMPAFSLKQTFLMIWWPGSYIMSAFWSAYIGGEVKQPGRNQMLGGFGALGWMSVWSVVVVFAMFHLLSEPFFVHLGTAFNTSSFGPGLTPIYPTLISGAIGNGYVTIAIMACFSVFVLVMIGANILLATRCIFAWSLDRIVPAWCSRVRAQSGSPSSAILMVVIGAVAFAILYTYGYLTVAESTWWFLTVFMLVMVAAILLPYRARVVWESSPNANRFLGIPTISWWGVAGIVGVAICMQNLIGDASYGVQPTHDVAQFAVGPILLVGAAIYYFGARALQRRRGIDTDLNFSRIPPE